MGMIISEMEYSQAAKIKVPSEVFDRGIRKTVTYRAISSGGGIGMGEYPGRVELVLSDGVVYEWNQWTENPTIVSYHSKEQADMSF